MRIFPLFRGLGPGPAGEVYKSNSSLDLDHEIDILQVNLLRHCRYSTGKPAQTLKIYSTGKPKLRHYRYSTGKPKLRH